MNYFCLLLLNILGSLISVEYNGEGLAQNVILKGHGQRRPGCGRRCNGRPTESPNPPQYTCVPAGTCPTGPNIDVRIVTPNQPTPSVCPPGQVPCYNQNQQLIDCGRRTVSPVSNADGPSTNGAFPWQAYIENQTHYTGSGVLISTNFILTAAHKVNSNRNSPQNIRIYMGVWDATQRASAQIRTASQINIPNNFNPNTLHNDIAVVRLDRPVQLGNNVAITCLPSQGQQFIGQRCVVAGWGQTSFGRRDAPNSFQKQVFVTIVDHATCRNRLSNPSLLGSSVDAFLDPNGEFCAGGELNRDACTQDGGAPLICQDGSGRFITAGLVIWGKGCGRRSVYGVYVDVSKYRNYIDRYT